MWCRVVDVTVTYRSALWVIGVRPIAVWSSR